METSTLSIAAAYKMAARLRDPDEESMMQAFDILLGIIDETKTAERILQEFKKLDRAAIQNETRGHLTVVQGGR